MIQRQLPPPQLTDCNNCRVRSHFKLSWFSTKLPSVRHIHFCCHRLSLITEIVKEVIPEMEITPEGLRQCVQLIDNLEPSQQLSLGPPPPNILWKATETTGFPHTHFLGPPCVPCICLQCQGRLVVHNPPTAVIWYSRDGPLPAAKIVLRCRNCSIQYHPDMFGNKQAGFRFYNTVQPVVQCSQQAYI